MNSIAHMRRSAIHGVSQFMITKLSIHARKGDSLQNPFVEHIIFSFSENIISRFDVAVNDVVKEFAEKLRLERSLKLFLFIEATVFMKYLEFLPYL